MGQTTYTQVLGDVLSSSLSDTRQEVVDNIHKNNVFLAKLNMDGRRKTFDGGPDIRRTVEYGLNNTVNSFTGYDVLPRVGQETLTDTIWTPKNYGGNWVISWEEERQNAGRAHKIRDVVDVKINSLEKSFSEGISSDILNPASFTSVGNGGKDITPLTMLVSRAALTVGSISETTNSWWAPQRKKSVSSNNTATNFSVIAKEMRNIYNNCGKYGDGFPNLLLGTQGSYELYEAGLDFKMRYQDPNGVASIGFDSLKFKRAEFVWDMLVPMSSANSAATVAYDSGSAAEENVFFLNTKYFYIDVDSGADFITTPKVSHESAGQFASSGAMLARMELLCTNRRAQGFYHGLDESAVVLSA